MTQDTKQSLERDLIGSDHIRGGVESKLFAHLLYAALCYVEWRHKDSGTNWSYTDRGAGRVVGRLRGEGDYTDWFLSKHEGMIDEIMLTDLEAIGWEPVSITKDEDGV